LKVKVVKEEATVDTIVKGKYDAAIVATGAVGQKLKVPGSDKPHVYTDLQVTGGKDKELGKTVIVVGGGVIATEIAVSQAMKGKKVIMTTRKTSEIEIADDESSPNRMCLMDMVKAYNVQINLGLTLKEVTDDGIISVDQEGKTHKFKGDSVVICAGFLPNNNLAKALKGKVKEVRSIGDCVKPRLIGDAIQEGWLAANQI
jgi:2-enoate reductase